MRMPEWINREVMGMVALATIAGLAIRMFMKTPEISKPLDEQELYDLHREVSFDDRRDYKTIQPRTESLLREASEHGTWQEEDLHGFADGSDTN